VNPCFFLSSYFSRAGPNIGLPSSWQDICRTRLASIAVGSERSFSEAFRVQ
jgi:hypothetical protein